VQTNARIEKDDKDFNPSNPDPPVDDEEIEVEPEK
jgi:hypothetical protein